MQYHHNTYTLNKITIRVYSSMSNYLIMRDLLSTYYA
uniref:Uncharacterized protein n=1 Tax=Lepeophtheirus salmonis TaxID=72036 RepID=A0A0K2TBM4_LEPSM